MIDDGDDDGDVMRLWYLYDEDFVRFKQKACRYEPREPRALFTKAVVFVGNGKKNVESRELAQNVFFFFKFKSNVWYRIFYGIYG